MTTITIPLSDEQISDLINGKSVVIAESAIDQSKSEFNLLKSKYGSGNYICVAKWEHKSKLWYEQLVDNPFLNNHLDNATEVKLIHKKHKEILYAYLDNSNIGIEFFVTETGIPHHWSDVSNFIETYYEKWNYRLKQQQQYPIFKRNGYGEVFKIVDNAPKGFNVTCMLSNTLSRIGYPDGEQFMDSTYKVIPYDKEKELYHLQPVWCWDDAIGSSNKTIGFYIEDDCACFTNDNEIDSFGNIAPITPEQLKAMPFIWEMYNQLLKDNQ